MFRSSGPPGTLTLLTRLTHAIARAYSAAAALAAGNGSRQQLEQPPLYPDWSTRVRRMRDSRTIQDVWGQMLCAVPGLGQQTVEAITARYPTLPSLWSAYHQALSAPGGNKDGARMLLARLPHVNGLGSVSEAKSAIVYDTLFEGGS
uniref:Crossover junction endonuclease MUS81 n=2 Tax=Dunaliella tertiolecta TaxID=3047 RepID=A0A7S3VMP4_DUNTE